MTDRVRFALFAAGIVPLGVFLVWAVAGLSPFGYYPGPYGDVVNAIATAQRHVLNVATAVNFDYRGFDTLGEEYILFTSVAGLILILRERRQTQGKRTSLGETERADGVGALSLVLLPVIVVFGMYMAVHGGLTPGGGFQGGAIIASGFLLAYLGSGHPAFHAIGKIEILEVFESLGAAAYVVIGLAALGLGLSFLQNFMPLGGRGNLVSGGTIWAINIAVMLEVATGLVIALSEFLKEIEP
ncbi:MAG TPA: MnhB domain-containing protein [Candidatus Acidoferrales bacterium]|nr:MnhB domain-containing protein [Candidatus Acidoferrales bacterium]